VGKKWHCLETRILLKTKNNCREASFWRIGIPKTFIWIFSSAF